MKNILQKNMFWVMLLLLVFGLFFQKINKATITWNLNHSIGWGWNDPIFIWQLANMFLLISLPCFTLGYGLLYFMKKETKFLTSGLHVFVTLFLLFIPPFNFSLTIILFLVAWLFFAFNMLTSKKTNLESDYV